MDVRLQGALDRYKVAEARPLKGDAGTRQYYRVDHPHLGTAIVVLYPQPEPGKPDDPYYEFRALHAYLDPVVRVPTLIQCDDDARTMLLEDLGDVTLERRMLSHPEEESRWAEEVGANLATWLGILTEGAPSRAFFMLRAFDAPKFAFEWDFCRKNFFESFLRKDPPRWLDRLMEEVHDSLVPRARVLVHRDYHVRNLMVQGDQLVTLDFQDARKGPATYDLASILFDGYWDWSEEAQVILLRHVARQVDADDAELWEELLLTALQRNLKALGTFGHQLVFRQRTQFASAIPRTLRHLRGHFLRMHHGDGVLAAEQWMRRAEQRLLERP